MALDVRARAGGGVRVSVHVQPRAARSEIAGVHGQALKVRLHAPPVDGAANEALVAFLADTFALPRRAVRIVSGHAGRAKIVELDGLDPDAVRHAAGEG
ncbi:MAG: DUF167 domain-containing protein [Gemmatimonadaceae bacterium]